MKAIMISIKPKWVAKILNGEKTIEIRKTCPEIFKHLKPYEGCSIDVYIYCTKDKKSGLHYSKEYGAFNDLVGGMEHYSTIGDGCGKVVAKFTLKHIDNLSNHFTTPYLYTKETCLTWEEILNYRNNGLCYAWHISNLEIFDKPKELNEFHGKGYEERLKRELEYSGDIAGIVSDTVSYWYRIKKAPQNYCYVEIGK